MAGNYSHQLRLIALGISGSLDGAIVTGDLSPLYSKLIPASSTNMALLLPAFALGNLQSIFIKIDAGTLTLKTNSTGSPNDTFTLSPLAPFSWQKNSGITNPFVSGVNPSTWYGTNGATALTITAYILTG